MKRKLLKWIGLPVLTLFLLFILALIYVTIREYRPDKTETVAASTGEKTLALSDTVNIMTYNIGYGGLDKTQDFFMDGGKKVYPAKKETVEENLTGIVNTMKSASSDIYFLQEIDLNSKRSYGINERTYLENEMKMKSMFAYNFKCDYVPYPLPTIGHVESGLATYTNFHVTSTTRHALPESFSWPLKTCNLKRCLLDTRIPISGTDRELVLFNLHLEAYDSGNGKLAQSKLLAEILEKEYAKGNYVIAGGDFNQVFDQVEGKYPVLDKSGWMPGTIASDSLPDGFSFAIADNYPTCRVLNHAYTGSYSSSQVYVIDGFIVSDNLNVKQIEVKNVDFEYTDHQPVQLSISFLP